MAIIWDIPGPSALAGASAALAYLAWRGRGLRPADACRCGYRLTGNTSGVCPECGLPADEGRRSTEQARVVLALRRLAYWVLAVALAGLLVAVLTLRALGERTFSDCRAVMAPRERLYAQVELLWRVDQPGEGSTVGRSRAVEARVTGLDGGVATRTFAPGTPAAEAGAWLVARCPTGADAKDEAEEFAGAVERALSGARVVLTGGAGSAHTLLAASAVQTAERPRWPTVLVLVVGSVGCVWGGRAVLRRAMARG